MSLSDSLSETPSSRGDGGPSAAGRREPRSWMTGEAFQNFARSPSAAIGLPGGKRARLSTDRVRAAPALTPTLSGTLGQNALGLAVWGLAAPNSVNRFLGMNANPQAIQLLFGARELATGLRLVSDPTCKMTLWARVAGDIFDIAVLRSLDKPENPKRRNVRTALGVVLAVTALDALAAVRMSTVKRTCD
ncbi:hypothetical protein [Phenylobacterium sp.]|uniref:hypothetical protein n=1 Tax=Phenylobacterium sp. TaxID=1871053 RepID=UPI0028127F74|nr:hypothetical protein [Phenylobacterium sp.]